jgi:hypothetical protein
MLRLATKDDLQRLIDDEIQESLTLDYKESAALAKDSRSRDELCKDVSAFANSAGGRIIYGIVEKDRKPVRVDEGTELPREWVEQVIDSNVQQRIEGLLITPIPVSTRHNACVITIPQALARAPHQAPDKKYYKRQNFQSVPMEDYEVRDALRRATTPELHLDLSFATGRIAHIEFPSPSERSKPISVIATITNHAVQPACHALVKVGVDTDLPLRTLGNFYQITGDDPQQYWLGYQFSSPPGMPIFKEMDPAMGLRLDFTISYPLAQSGRDRLFRVTTSVQTPGYSATDNWIIHARGNALELSVRRPCIVWKAIVPENNVTPRASRDRNSFSKCP